MQTRTHKIKSDYGLRNYYKFYIKNNPKSNLSRVEYSSILRECFIELGNLVISEDYTWRLPHGFGKVFLSQRPTSTTFKDGKLKTNRPPDMKATMDLWKVNPEAKAKKTLVYFENFHTNGNVMYIMYSVAGANYKLKNFYKMQFNRTLKRNLAQSIFAGKVNPAMHKKFKH